MTRPSFQMTWANLLQYLAFTNFLTVTYKRHINEHTSCKNSRWQMEFSNQTTRQQQTCTSRCLGKSGAWSNTNCQTVELSNQIIIVRQKLINTNKSHMSNRWINKRTIACVKVRTDRVDNMVVVTGGRHLEVENAVFVPERNTRQDVVESKFECFQSMSFQPLRGTHVSLIGVLQVSWCSTRIRCTDTNCCPDIAWCWRRKTLQYILLHIGNSHFSPCSPR